MSICRVTYAKEKSKKLFYRCYKNFDNKLFEETLIKNLFDTELFLKRDRGGGEGVGVVFSDGREMKILITIFQEFWKNMVGKRYFQH